MSHIVIDARIINTSTGTYVERLLNYLQKIDKKNTYTILVPLKDIYFFKPKSKNFTIKPINIKNYSLKEQFYFIRLLSNLKPDLVHFCMPQQPIFYKGLSVTTFHDLTLLKTYNSDKNWFVYHFKQLIGSFVFYKSLRKNKYILTDTNYVKNDILNNYKINASKIFPIHLSADVSIEKIEEFKHPFDEYILYVGQQSDYKNIKRLGEAHQKLLKKYPNLGLILVGKINKSVQKNKYYFESKNYKNILFTGFLPNSQRDYLYKNARAYIFPSLMEGFGLPGLEAMGYGTPVISSNTTCLPEVYGDAAYYFNPLNVTDIANSIDDVISSEKLRSDLIKKGYNQLKKYSWERMAQETLNVYKKALDN